MRVILLLLLTTFCLYMFAAPTEQQKQKALQAAREKTKMSIMKKGGFVIHPDSCKGKIAIIDTQNRAAIRDPFFQIVQKFQRHLSFNIVYVHSNTNSPQQLRKENKADFAIVVVDDKNTPSTLIAPDERWAIVNVAKFSEGFKSLESRKNIYNDRCSKAVLRAFVLLCGGGGSRYGGHVAAATSIKEIDLAHDQLPHDIQQGIKSFLVSCNVTPQLRIPYERACREGWAPAPTNDYQKAIWDKVRSEKERGPTNPIEIPMPKK